jgi:hypothetical protein
MGQQSLPNAKYRPAHALIPVSEIDEVIPEQRRLILRASPRLLGS